MKLGLTSFLILMSASLACFASGETFSFKSGRFDSKHFASRSQASLELKAEQMAHLKIITGPEGLQRTALDQTFAFLKARKDSCNVQVYESGTLPVSRTIQRLSSTGRMTAKIIVRDSRLSTCTTKSAGFENRNIEITILTKTATSVGTSTLQFDAIQTELALDNGRRMRAPALIIKGESTLVDLTSL